MTISEWIALLVSLLTAGALVIKSLSERVSVQAASDVSVAAEWRQMLEPLQKQLTAVQNRTDTQDKEIEALKVQNRGQATQIARQADQIARHEDGILRLAAQVVSLGGKPVYVIEASKP